MNVLGKNTEKCKTFFVLIEKVVTKIDTDGKESVVTISYKTKFINSAKFMAWWLSNLVDNLAEVINKNECKNCDCFLEYESVEDNLIKDKFLSCNTDYSNKLDEKSKKRFKKTFKFSNNDINKFMLLLRKGVYQLKYERYYRCRLHAGKRVFKDFEIKNLGEYHDLNL